MMDSDDGRDDTEFVDVDISDQKWGSDFITDLLKAYGFEYVVFNPGASFRGLEESIVNYNDNTPTVIETPNEGVSVAISHGIAKATGDPALCVLHNVVGTMNGAMGIYNAFIDRVPVLILSGTGPMQKSQRRPWIDWIHSANVQGNIVRDYVKWDDQPTHIDGAAESIVRAYEIAATKPYGPTYVTIDHELQECELDDPMSLPDLSRFSPPSPMAPDPDAISQAAALLADAELPIIVVDQVGDSPEAVEALVEFAELLAAPVFDSAWRRFNFPNTHPLYLSESDVYREADVVLAIDAWDVDSVTGDFSTSLSEEVDGDVTLIDIGTHELEASGLFPNTYAAHETDVPILADSALAIPMLRDEVESRLAQDETADRRIRDRYESMSERHSDLRSEWWDRAEEVWDKTPVSTPRLAGEIWNVIQDDQWVLVNDMFPRWADRLWEVEEFDQYIGGNSGGGGVGYGIGASVGAALAYADSDRIPVNIQGDGDLMQYLSALWVAGHYDIPLFTVMHNNKSMHNSTKHRMELAEYRERDASYERALIGTGFVDPTPDYASIASGMGVSGYGPVTDPDDLGLTLQAAWDEVREGTPVLVDVVCQPD